MTAEQPNAGMTHISARGRWGQPDERSGSVNDPRVHEEHGIRYNERWVYHLERGKRRLVYWERYDFRGVVLEDANGRVTKEAI